MYDEDHILGPLTLRQTLIAGVGVGGSAALHYFAPEYLWLIALIVPGTGLLVWRYRAHRIEDPRAYFMHHKNGRKRLARMIAEVEFRRTERKARGKKPDLALDATLDKLREIQNELKQLELTDTP